jgi:hypothetical protein
MPSYISRGTISDMSEVQSGTTIKGSTWNRMTLTLEIAVSTSAIIKQVFQVFGDKVDEVLKYKRGDEVEITFSLYAKEWNGKLYNNVDLWGIKPLFLTRTKEAQPAQADPQPQSLGAPKESDDPKDDLPF